MLFKSLQGQRASLSHGRAMALSGCNKSWALFSEFLAEEARLGRLCALQVIYSIHILFLHIIYHSIRSIHSTLHSSLHSLSSLFFSLSFCRGAGGDRRLLLRAAARCCASPGDAPCNGCPQHLCRQPLHSITISTSYYMNLSVIYQLIISFSIDMCNQSAMTIDIRTGMGSILSEDAEINECGEAQAEAVGAKLREARGQW